MAIRLLASHPKFITNRSAGWSLASLSQDIHYYREHTPARALATALPKSICLRQSLALVLCVVAGWVFQRSAALCPPLRPIVASALRSGVVARCGVVDRPGRVFEWMT